MSLILIIIITLRLFYSYVQDYYLSAVNIYNFLHLPEMRMVATSAVKNLVIFNQQLNVCKC